jgi:recombination protein RecA
MEIRKGPKLEAGTGDAKEAHGNVARIKIVKNKVAPPFRTAEVDIMFNEGISKMGDLLEVGVKKDIVQKAGAFYSFADTRLGQGKAKSVDFLRDNPKVAAEIEKLVREKAFA